MARILILDDERALAHSMKLQLTRLGHECDIAQTLAEAKELLDKTDPDLAIFDIRLPDGNGLDLVGRLRQEGRSFPIVVLTAFGSIPSAVRAMREGTSDYIEKPIDLEQLCFIVDRNLETHRLRGKIELYERTSSEARRDAEIIGESESMLTALKLAARVANPGVKVAGDMPTVLLTGETGAGKDLFARHIHDIGPLAKNPFVQVDCTTLPRELIETELFGHERGAFTDARTAKRGLLEIASEGTIFLNEIGEMPIELQTKLLTALECKTFRRVGGTRTLPFNVRIIVATNAALPERVAQGKFREDLYYRLNVFSIELPPLRRRGEDSLLLAEHFIGQLARKYGQPAARLSPAAKAEILRYRWPGNVRELRHVLERAVLLQVDGAIGPQQLGIAAFASPQGPQTRPQLDDEAANATLPQVERLLIKRAMEKSGGNVSQAARILGISRGALRRRLEQQ